MKIRIALLLLLMAFLLSGVWIGVEAAPCYHFDSVTLSGGRYQLSNTGLHPGETSEGGAYHLVGPGAPRINGNGCCCTFLPLVHR
jgi:hypothetical protein